MTELYDVLDAVQDVRRLMRAAEEEGHDVHLDHARSELIRALETASHPVTARQHVAGAAAKLAAALYPVDEYLADDALEVARQAAPIDGEQ